MALRSRGEKGTRRSTLRRTHREDDSAGARVADACRPDGMDKVSSQEGLQILFEQLPMAVWAVDRELRVTGSGGANLSGLGLSTSRVVGMTLASCLGNDDPAQALIAAHREALTGTSGRIEIERGGRVYLTHLEPMRHPSGSVRGVVGLAEDVTIRKRIDSQIQQEQKMDAIGRLSTRVSHDFNTYLTVITGFCDLVLAALGLTASLPTDEGVGLKGKSSVTPDHGESIRTYVGEIRNAADKASDLTRQLLSFSRQQTSQSENVDLNSLIHESREPIRQLLGSGIELALDLKPHLPRVNADPSSVQRTLLDLAENARDAMPDGGRLSISTAAWDPASTRRLPKESQDGEVSSVQPIHSRPYVRLAVADTGCGMDSVTSSRIFEPFFTTKSRGKCAGINLARVYTHMQQCGGEVVVESQQGHGSVFHLFFSIRSEPAS